MIIVRKKQVMPPFCCFYGYYFRWSRYYIFIFICLFIIILLILNDTPRDKHNGGLGVKHQITVE